ncbi:MAG: hypothetical protein ACOCYC_03605 [bacterium]
MPLRIALIYAVALGSIATLAGNLSGTAAVGIAPVLTAAAFVVFLVLALPVLNLQGRLLVGVAVVAGHVLLALYVFDGTAMDGARSGAAGVAGSDAPAWASSVAWASARAWADAVANGAGFAVLFASIPFSAFFIGATGDQAGRNGTDGNSTPSRLGGRGGRPPSLLKIAVVQFALSIALTIGSLWVTRPLYDTTSAPRASRYRAVSAAYSGNVAFSPLDPVVNLALVLAGIAYTEYMFLGLGLLGLIILATVVNEVPTWLRGRREARHRGAHRIAGDAGAAGKDSGAGGHSPGASAGGPESETAPLTLPPSFARVFLRAVVLIGMVVAGKLVIDFPNEVAETGIILAAVSVALSLLFRGPQAVAQTFRRHPYRMRQFVSVLALIGAALFLAAAIAESPAAEAVSSVAIRASRLPLFLSALAIVALTAALAFVGVHMFLTVGTIGALLTPALLGISPPAFALLLVTSYIVGMNLSPLVPFTIASAELNEGRSSLTAVRHHVGVWLLVALAGCGVVTLV